MTEQVIESIPARIIQRTLSVEQLTALIQADLGDIEPFFWPAEISSNRLDFYFGRMAESTLKNFANDATAGVSFLDSHNSRSLGYGQSLNGTFEQTSDLMRTVVDFYTVPGIRFANGLTYASTDDFIRAVVARVTRDVSVGVYGGERICDICGEDIYEFDWDTWRYACPHVPGVVYPIGDRGEETILATFTWENGRLAEVSSVYDGATPGAAIGKAQRMIDGGDIPAALMQQLEIKYHLKAPDKQWSGFDKQERRKNMSGKNEPNELELIRSIVEESGAPESDLPGAVRWLADGLVEANEERDTLTAENARLVERVAELTPLADDGRSYREALVESAMVWGARAMGDKFPEETYQTMFDNPNTPIDQIQRLLESWGGQASEVFSNGRETEDADPTEGQERTVDLLNFKPVVPESAYM